MMSIHELKSIVSRIPVLGPTLKVAYQKMKSSTPGKAPRLTPSNHSWVAQDEVPDWSEAKNVLPWFDRPDALEVLERKRQQGEVGPADYELLKKWIVDGYVIIDTGVVPEADIDGMIEELDALFHAQVPFKDLLLLGVSETEGGPGKAMLHADVLALSKDIREKMPTNSNWRIHEFHAWSDSARRIYQNEELQRICSLIFGREAYPRSTINFMYGSQQLAHQDMAVFHIFPHNYLIGMWLACENIHPESGPLVYYPGSHRLGMWERFDSYPQTQLRTCTRDEHDGYHEWVAEAAKAFERKEFIAKKGQVLLWHGSLIHGGSGIKRKGLTRKSFVTHYLVDGVDHTRYVKGPFNWN